MIVIGTITGIDPLTNFSILPDAIYQGTVGGTGIGVLSVGRTATNLSGTYKPWPYPTAEEILTSESFKTKYNQPGAIGWALSQPDGTVVDLRVENICGSWYDGQVLGLREWFEPVPNGSNLFLYLDKPIKLDERYRDMTTIDIIGGKLTTLKDGRRALIKPEAVYVYTDALGRWMLSLPWPKHVGDTKDEWPWKLKVAP